MVIAAGIFVTLGYNVNAQAPEESRVKILPGPEPGIVKVLYAMEVNHPLEIKFITDRGVITSDRIKGKYPKGLSKRYDVRRFKSDFRIELSSPNMTVTFHIFPSQDGLTYKSFLEKTTYNHSMVASNNQ
jgi:hypothetical protein